MISGARRVSVVLLNVSMALETLALTTLRASCTSTVCMCVKLWSCFHCKLDNDTIAGRRLFCSSLSSSAHWQEASWDAEIEKQLCRSSPKGYREKTSTARGYRRREAIPLFKLWIRQIVQSDVFYLDQTVRCGFGVFARRRISFKEARDALFGWLSPISGDDFRDLELANHPSLLAHYILIGALSLVNHSCASTVAFGKPQTPASSDLVNAPAFVVEANGDCMMLKLFDTSFDETHCKWNAGEEICVNYGPNAFRKCKCNVCYSVDDSSTGTEPERKRNKE